MKEKDPKIERKFVVDVVFFFFFFFFNLFMCHLPPVNYLDKKERKHVDFKGPFGYNLFFFKLKIKNIVAK